MQAIDIHAHLVPRSLTTDVNRLLRDFPNVAVEGDADGPRRFRFGRSAWTRSVMPGLLDVQRRLGLMERQHVTHQINGGWLDAFGYELPAPEGVRWSRFLNDRLSECVNGVGHGRLSAWATVPLMDGEAAAAEAERAHGLGFRGIMIGSWVPPSDDREAMPLDDSRLEPFWSRAAELRMPIFVHPSFEGENPRAKDWGLDNAVLRPGETSLAMARMLMRGIPQRYPDLTLIIAHGGGTLPYLWGRLLANAELVRLRGGDVPDLADGWSRLYFDSLVFDPGALGYLIGMAGASQILLGSDAPFPIGDTDPRRVVERGALAEPDRARILAGNAERLGLRPDAGHGPGGGTSC